MDKLRIVVPLALLVTVGLWLSAAKLGGERPDGPVAAVEVQSPPPTSLPSPTHRPGDLVLVRADGLRTVDLGSGELGPRIGPTEWPNNRVLTSPDGRAWCICGTSTTTGQDMRLELRLAAIDDEGRPDEGVDLGHWTGSPDPALPQEQQGDAAWSTATMAPDGSMALVGVAVRRPPAWERHVLLLDLASRRLVETIELPGVPSNDDGIGVYGWAPEFRFAPDRRHALFSAGVVTGDRITEHRVWLADVSRAGLADLRAVEPFGIEACYGSAPGFGTAEMLYAVCSRTLHRVGVDGGVQGDVDLSAAVNADTWPNQLIDPSRGRLYLWDPFGWRAVAIDVESGKVLAAITVPGARSASGGGLAALARSLADWVAPSVRAKMMLEPGLALSADGLRLYVVGFRAGEEEQSEVIVLDAAGRFDLLERWVVPGLVNSIGLREDGTVLLAMLPIRAGTEIRILDASSGHVRSTAEQLGPQPLVIVDPDWEGG